MGKVTLTHGNAKLQMASHEAAGNLHVTIHAISGNSWKLDTDPLASFHDLQNAIALQTGVEPMCQQILHGDEVLYPSATMQPQTRLQDHFPASSQLVVTLIRSLESVYAGLQAVVQHTAANEYSSATNSQVAPCQQLLRCILRNANKQDEQARDLVYELCNNYHADIRAEAVRALPALVHAGDEKAVNILLRRLRDGGHPWHGSRKTKVCGHPVRVATIKALAEVSTAENRNVKVGLLGCIRDVNEEDTEVITAAIDALVGLDCMKDTNVVERLLRKACSDAWRTWPNIRMHALKAITSAAPAGDYTSLRGCLYIMFNEMDTKIRQFASNCFTELARPGDLVLLAVITGLRSKHSWARRLAAEALGHVSEPCDQTALNALFQCAGDTNSGVRVAVIKAMTKIAPHGDSQAESAVLGRLDDWSSDVRKAAVEAIQQFMERDLEDEATDVQSSADSLSESDEDITIAGPGWHFFDGNKTHKVLPFVGPRLSYIWDWQHRRWQRL